MSPLSADEIVAEALRQFDEGSTGPTVRQLAAGLSISASAIYYHFPSRSAIFSRAVDLVWQEATEAFLSEIPDPLTAPPVDVLIQGALAIRRAFGSHHRLVPFLAVSSQSEGPLEFILSVAEHVFTRLGLKPASAAACFHTYSSFVLGSIIFEGMRRITNEQLLKESAAPIRPRVEQNIVQGASSVPSSTAMHQALLATLDLSTTDPAADEELFCDGLRRIVNTFEAGQLNDGRPAASRKAAL